MTTLFISDLHLDAARPHIIDLFADFIENEARDAEALYILGDLFEAWIGDDDNDETGERIARILSGLGTSGVPCFFIAGNRDFLVGDAWGRRAGLTFLCDPAIIDLYGQRTLLMHGDLLCTDDLRYQAVRAQLHDPAWQRDFLTRSLIERRSFAAHARAESQRYTRDPSNTALMDVNDEAVEAIMQRHKVLQLIHGHTHRPMIHALSVGGQRAQRIVLGDWYEQGSVLRLDAGGAQLEALRPPS